MSPPGTAGTRHVDLPQGACASSGPSRAGPERAARAPSSPESILDPSPSSTDLALPSDPAATAEPHGRGAAGEGSRYDYIHAGEAIYARSFAIIRAEADLSGRSDAEARIAVRVVHACGMVAVAPLLRFGGDFAARGRTALLAGAPVLCDSRMVSHGVTRARLPSTNAVECLLDHPDVPALAARLGTTRSAAAVQLWGARMGGCLAVIGNAPTALFHLLECIDAGAAPPAAVIGLPVGFVGAAESKDALAAHGVPFLTLPGRMGGSAMAAAAVNALASEAE